MLEQIKAVASEYGVAAALSFMALSVVGWLFRVSLKNPVEVVSRAMQDIETARLSLRDEINHKDREIKALRERVKHLEDLNDELKIEVMLLREKHR